VARELELVPATSRDALEGKRFEEAIDADIDEGQGLKVAETPFFLLNGRPPDRVKNEADFYKFVDEELKIAESLVAQGVARAEVYSKLQERAHDPLPPERRTITVTFNVPGWGGGDAVPVSVVVFCSVTDFVCRRMGGVLDELSKTYDRHVGYFWIEVPPKDDPTALLAAEALSEAVEQKDVAGFLELKRRIEEAYKQRQPITQTLLEFQARQAGLDVTKLRRALADHVHAREIDQARRLAADAKVESPSLLIAARPPTVNTEGFYLPGAPPTRVIRNMIDRAMREQKGESP
jgi:predicted DsbA family dithiol-disulfide isomerase